MREALKLALEALEYNQDYDTSIILQKAAITAIKKALAQPEQEPHGYLYKTGKFYHEVEGCNPKTDKRYLPLYTIPPQRTWVGLTIEEEKEAMDWCVAYGVEGVVSWISDKLKEKNHE